MITPDRTRIVAVAVILMMVIVVALGYRAWDAERDRRIAAENALDALDAKARAEQGEAEAEAGEETAVAGADAAAGYLREACTAGDRGACRLREEIDAVLAELDQVRDDPETQDPETQELETQDPELQEPEVQEPEIQEPERPDAEQQDPEAQEPEPDDAEVQDEETQDGEVQDPEVDDPDPDDPEIQQPEQQDPERDDPDPNSGLTFAARDDCQPGDGEYAVDPGIAIERTDGVVTVVLTCTTAPVPPGLTR